eukprot:1161421-Pelagomonas_calceolata.AAC.5
MKPGTEQIRRYRGVIHLWQLVGQPASGALCQRAASMRSSSAILGAATAEVGGLALCGTTVGALWYTCGVPVGQVHFSFPPRELELHTSNLGVTCAFPTSSGLCAGAGTLPRYGGVMMGFIMGIHHIAPARAATAGAAAAPAVRALAAAAAAAAVAPAPLAAAAAAAAPPPPAPAAVAAGLHAAPSLSATLPPQEAPSEPHQGSGCGCQG